MFPFKREILLPLIMNEPTEYELLLKDEEYFLTEIDETKKELRRNRYDLKKIRKELLKYSSLSVVHISDQLERIEN